MNLKDEKFLAGLKAAIESGKNIELIEYAEDEHGCKIFNSDESLSAVVKFLEESKPETTKCESCQKTVPLEWAIISGDEDTCYKCYSEMASDYIRTWIPIEEAVLVSGEKYDVFYFDPAWRVPGHRMPDMIYQPGQFITDNVIPMCYSASKVTHIMKRPADPEN